MDPARSGGEHAHGGVMSISFLLALVALACGILLLVSGRWSKFPLTAIAIICLALNESGLLH
jgi:hypothetical protein